MLQALRRTYLDIFTRYPVLVRLAAVGGCVGMVYALINNYALPLYLHDNLKVSAVVIGWVSSTFLAAEMLMKFPLGRLSDRIGRRTLIASGPAVSCVTALILPLVPAARYVLLYPLRALDGMALAAVWPAAFALVTDKIPASSRAAAMAVLFTVYMAGLAIGPALGGVLMLVIANPWLRDRSPFYLASGAFLLVATIARLGLPAPRAQAVVAPPFVEPDPMPLGARSGLAARPPAWVMALVLFITALQLIALTILQPFLALYGVQVMHLSKAQVPLLFLVPALAVAALGLPMGHLSDRWGKARSVKLAMALAAGAMAVLPLFSNIGAVILIVTVLLVAYLLGTPAWLALIAELAPAGAFGGTLGAVATAQGVGASIGPIIGGHLWVIDYRYSFWASAALLGLCALLATAFLPWRPQSQATQPESATGTAPPRGTRFAAPGEP
jgi:MFS family permease